LIQDDVKQFNLTIKPCPPGHALQVTDTEDEYQCKCDDNNVNIVECMPNNKKIILEVSVAGLTLSITTYNCIRIHRKVFGPIMLIMILWIAS